MAKSPKRVALYLRVSTTGQSVANQRQELEEAAARHSWDVVAVYQDAGISGAKAPDKRPGLNKLMMAVARREIDMVAAWSVDRLGRSLQDLVRHPRQGRGPVPSPTRARYHHAFGQGDVPDDGRFR